MEKSSKNNIRCDYTTKKKAHVLDLLDRTGEEGGNLSAPLL